MANSLFGLTYSILQQDSKLLILHKGSTIRAEHLESIPVTTLQGNTVPHVLMTKIEETDLNISIQYDITAKKTLAEYVGAKKLTMEEFYRLLHKISSIISRSNHYMLSENNYIVHNENFIYVGHNLEDIHLAYVPLHTLETKQPLPNELSILARRLIKYVIQRNDISYGIVMAHIENPSFTLETFKELLTILIADPNRFDHTPIEEIEQPQQLPKNTTNKKYFIILGILLLVVSWSIEYILETDMAFYISLGVAAFAILLILAGVKPAKQKLVLATETSAGKLPSHTKKKTNQSSHPMAERHDDATVLLGGVQQSVPTHISLKLQFKDGKRIVMNGNTFVVGRNPDLSNYVVNAVGVSRAHFKIIRYGPNHYVIQDLGSKNKTELNGKTLEANIEYPLQRNDLIKFAKEEFTVIIGD